MIEVKQKCDEPRLRVLDRRGREGARQLIYPHRRSKSPPRLKTTVIEKGKMVAKQTLVRITPEVIKEMLPSLVRGARESLKTIGEYVPGAKLVGRGGLTLLQGIEVTLDMMPTAMRRTARTLGFPQNWAQNIGDATHLLQDIALIVLPLGKGIRGEEISSLMDAQEVAPLISGGMLMLAGGKAVKVTSPSLGKKLPKQLTMDYSTIEAAYTLRIDPPNIQRSYGGRF